MLGLAGDFYSPQLKGSVNIYTGLFIEHLPPVTIYSRRNSFNAFIIQNHVYQNSKYHQHWRDEQNYRQWNSFAGGLQNFGDSLAGAGYVLTLTGVGAEIGIPLAALGNGISTAGAVIQAANSFYNQGLGSKNGWKTVGFQVAGRIAGNYLNKVLGLEPAIKSIDGSQAMNLSNRIIQQNVSLKLMGIERYYDYKTKN